MRAHKQPRDKSLTKVQRRSPAPALLFIDKPPSRYCKHFCTRFLYVSHPWIYTTPFYTRCFLLGFLCWFCFHPGCPSTAPSSREFRNTFRKLPPVQNFSQGSPGIIQDLHQQTTSEIHLFWYLPPGPREKLQKSEMERETTWEWS